MIIEENFSCRPYFLPWCSTIKLGPTVRFGFYNFPLPEHKNALQAALTLEAAGKQNQYWEMYNLLNDEFKAHGDKAMDSGQILTYAEKLGLNITEFKQDLNDTRNLEYIQNDHENGKILGVGGIPTVFINGIKVEGANGYETYSNIIDEELAGK